MKIQCQSCQAKYTIADEKVLGKVVKIRCKKCSSTIVINGNEHSAADAGGDGQAFDYASSGNEPWTVNVADGDQRTLTIAEIIAEYKAGVVNDETYCWKDGMADWLPLREIEAIYSALSSNGGSIAPAAQPEPARISAAPAAAPLFAAAASPADSPFAAAPGNGGGGSAALFGGAAGAAVEQSAPAAAARRAGGRAQGADLFGNAEKAGGEDDVMTSALGGGGGGGGGGAGLGASHVDDKLTGQRNENSVLFSLSALTDKPKETSGSGNRTTATAEGSGLIDIRALSASMDDGDKKNTGARVDDIMNLSGGGAFGAALAAPILAPPPLEAVDLGVMASGEAPKQNKTLIFAILGGCAFIAIAIVAVAALMRSPTPDTTKTEKTGVGALPEGTPTAAPTGDPAAAAATGAAPAAAADNTPPPPGTGNNATKAVVNPGATPKAAAAGAAPKTDHVAAAAPAAPAPEAPKAPAQPASLADAMGAAAGKPAAAPAAGGGASSAPFDRGAAAAALGKVDVQSCKKADGPTGSGHVTVTFGPDGSVQSAIIDGGSFPGTPVGGCIAGKFRGAHVPPFGGAAVRVGKSFTVN